MEAVSLAAELARCATRGSLSSSVCVLVQNRHGHQLPGPPAFAHECVDKPAARVAANVGAP